MTRVEVMYDLHFLVQCIINKVKCLELLKLEIMRAVWILQLDIIELCIVHKYTMNKDYKV